jgi:hypothetical protein
MITLRQPTTNSGIVLGILSQHFHVGRLQSFGASRYLKADFLALGERSKSVTLNGSVMNENVFTGLSLDKAITFTLIEPFNLSCLFHAKKTPEN